MTATFWKRVIGVVLFSAVLGGLIVFVQWVPEWQVHRAGVHSAVVEPKSSPTPADVATLQNEMRKTLLQIVGGAFAIFALWLTFRRVIVAEQGHITERYTRAIEQLGAMRADGKPNVEVRLGAIYALERIAKDSARDHWTIMEVLTAYVRQNAPAPAQASTIEENQKAIDKGPATEIQAILTVLGRRQRGRGREQEGQSLNLSHSDLRGASISGAHLDGMLFSWAYLDGAYFNGAYLDGAYFNSAHLDEAKFNEAHLAGADFCLAHLYRAYFTKAHLDGTYFNWAHLDGAYFGGVYLDSAYFVGEPSRLLSLGAHLYGADFREAVGLTVEQITKAVSWENARFDDAFMEKLKSFEAKKDSSQETTSEPKKGQGK